LGAGVPVVVLPVFGDQFTNGRLVKEFGTGLIVEAAGVRGDRNRQLIGPDDIPRIAEAITAVLHEPSYREAAEHIGSEMAATAPVDDVLASLVNGGLPGAART
jgi:UDP:flavonoid glycosyltransferase YjiC (YdhE family)